MTSYDVNDELYVIGACVLNSTDLHEALKKLHHGDFASKECSELFKIISSLTAQSRPVDERTVTELLPDDKRIHLLTTLQAAILHSHGIDADFYIEKVRSNANTRKLVGIHNLMATLIQQEKPPSDIIHQVQTKLSDVIAGQNHKERTLQEALDSFKDGMSYRQWLQERCRKFRMGELELDGFSSGYKYLDECINGFENGTYTIVGATTSSGKTTYIINLIINILKNDPKACIAFFSLEMSIPQLVHKLIGAYINVSPQKIKNGDLTEEELARVYQVEENLRHQKLIFNNETPATEASIRNNFRSGS